MNTIVKILIQRDEIDEQEAIELLDETREMIMTNPDDAEDIMRMQLGLETDYIFDII